MVQVEQLELFRPDILAKVKVTPGSEKARWMTDGSGQKLLESWDELAL